MQALWVSLGTLGTTILSFISAALLARYFDKETYGSYKQILYVYNSLNIFFAAGIPKVYSYYLPQFNISEGKEIVIKLSKLLFLCGLSFSVFLFLSAPLIADILNNDSLVTGLRYFSIVPVLVFPVMGLNGVLTTYRKTDTLLIYTIVSKTILLACILIPPMLFQGSLEDVILGWVIGALISLLIAIYMIRLPFKGIRSQGSDLRIKEILSYSVPIVLASVGGILLRSSDQFYISRYFGTEVFAEFSNGFVPLPFIGMVAGSASVILMPLFSKYFSENNFDKIRELWISTLEKSILLIFPPIALLIFYAKEVIVLIYTDVYVNSSKYFIVYLVSNLFSIIIFSPLLLATGSSKFYSKVHVIFAAVSWGLTYLVVILFNDPLIVAIFSRILNVILVVIILRKCARILNFKVLELLPNKRIGLVLCHCLLGVCFTMILDNYLQQLDPLISMIVGSIFFGAFLLITAPFIGLPYLEAFRPILEKLRIMKSGN